MTKLRLSCLLLSGLLVTACKSEEKKAAAPPPVVVSLDAAVAVAPAPAVDPLFPLAPGESVYGGQVMATNLLDWKTSDGTMVKIGIVTTGKDDQDHERGVLRAYHDGQGHDLQTYSLHAKADHWAELKALPNDRVLFRYGQEGEGRRARNAVLLRWDAEAKQVRLVKRWTGASKDVEPAWLTTGEYKPSTETQGLCAKIVARMVSCEKDPAFREALFRNYDATTRPAAEKDFQGNITRWKKPAEAEAQCQKWASDEYVDTHFSDVADLQAMADDTKMTCEFFGREIDDEGGMPHPISAVGAPR